jgi:hypothetical protein
MTFFLENILFILKIFDIIHKKAKIKVGLFTIVIIFIIIPVYHD